MSALQGGALGKRENALLIGPRGRKLLAAPEVLAPGIFSPECARDEESSGVSEDEMQESRGLKCDRTGLTLGVTGHAK